MTVPWIPVVEQLPDNKTVVIVGQSVYGRYRVFAGWLDDGVWYTFYPEHPNEIVAMHDATSGSGFVAEMGDLRAEDLWLPLPVYSPLRGGYPA